MADADILNQNGINGLEIVKGVQFPAKEGHCWTQQHDICWVVTLILFSDLG